MLKGIYVVIITLTPDRLEYDIRILLTTSSLFFDKRAQSFHQLSWAPKGIPHKNRESKGQLFMI